MNLDSIGENYFWPLRKKYSGKSDEQRGGHAVGVEETLGSGAIG